MQRCNGCVGREFEEIIKKVFLSVQTDFRQLVEDMIRKLPVEEVELFLVQDYWIWGNNPVIDSEEAEI